MEPDEFLSQAIQRGLITFAQAQEASKALVALQAAGMPDAKIWEVLVLQRLLSQEQVDALLSGTESRKAFKFGAFEIEAKIGEGGMGTVYRARKEGEEEQRVVALKVLPERFNNSRHVARFEREAKAAIALSHPNLVKGIEHGQINGRWYYAMELIEGKVLTKLIEERGRFEEKPAIQIAIQIAGALDAIHRFGLVHRDVKPENIILSQEGIAKLMDFGLVKSTVAELTALTHSGQTIGTLHYMSPEQIQGGDVDIRSDIYSLGATLYHVVTGAKPFKGTTSMEVLRKLMEHEFVNPQVLRPELSDAFCTMVARMMARNSSDRPQTPGLLIEELSRVLDGREPVRIPEPEPAPAPAPIEFGPEPLVDEPAPIKPALIGKRVYQPKPPAAIPVALPPSPPPPPERPSKRLLKRPDKPMRRGAPTAKSGAPAGLLIGGAVALIAVVVGIIAMTSPGGGSRRPTRGPAEPPEATQPPLPGTRIEESIRQKIVSGEFHEATGMIDLNAVALGSTADELRSL
ncbi:MAG TPA: serine/threonine-protein kinase, partial [Planctomycetota bacterium]|nr:serine/threonine-protein kinase [Planctomycetota bacterium]